MTHLNERADAEPPKIKHLLYLVGAVLFLWFSLGLLPYIAFTGIDQLANHNISKWGSLGDTFGMVNALFSGLAFAAILFTLWQQHIELKITREDLKQSIEAQVSAASSAEKQLELDRIRIQIDAMITRIENERAVGIARAGTTINDRAAVGEAEKNLNNLMRQLEGMIREL